MYIYAPLDINKLNPLQRAIYIELCNRASNRTQIKVKYGTKTLNLKSGQVIVSIRDFSREYGLTYYRTQLLFTELKNLGYINHLLTTIKQGKSLVISLKSYNQERVIFKESITKAKTRITPEHKEKALDFIEQFNKEYNTKYTSYTGWIDNFVKYLNEYRYEEIIEAMKRAKSDKWWKEHITPTILFRTKNKNGNCDNIGDLLNIRRRPTVDDMLRGAL